MSERAKTCRWCGDSLPEGPEPVGGVTFCRGCGVGTTDPWPDQEALNEAYSGWYRPATGRFSGLGDRLLRWSRGRLANRIDAVAPSGPVLDIGSGDGTLVDAVRRRGRPAVGVEREDDLAATAEPDGYAAVVLWHSLEHLPDPADALRSAADRLRHRGLLIVAVPNIGSLQARLFGSRWFARDLPRHLVHLTGPALRRRIEAIGLVVERQSQLRGGQVVFGWLHGLVGWLPGNPDLYDAIRRPEARRAPVTRWSRMGTLLAAVVLLPGAAAGAAIEIILRRSGTVYLEARRSA